MVRGFIPTTDERATTGIVILVAMIIVVNFVRLRWRRIALVEISLITTGRRIRMARGWRRRGITIIRCRRRISFIGRRRWRSRWVSSLWWRVRITLS